MAAFSVIECPGNATSRSSPGLSLAIPNPTLLERGGQRNRQLSRMSDTHRYNLGEKIVIGRDAPSSQKPKRSRIAILPPPARKDHAGRQCLSATADLQSWPGSLFQRGQTPSKPAFRSRGKAAPSPSSAISSASFSRALNWPLRLARHTLDPPPKLR